MKYTALTIGPIYKTLQSVKSTKAIWAASYMFSYLMRKIIKKSKLDRNKVILPFYNDSDLEDNNKLGVGLFPDRMIVEGEIDSLQSKIDEVIKEFAKEVNKDIGKNEDAVNSYLQEYINIHHFDIELDNAELMPKSNIIFKINSLLDTAELKQNIVSDADNNFLNSFFEMYKPTYNFLHCNEFTDDTKTFKKFKSTIEIASAEFEDKQFYKNAAKLIKRDAVYKDENGNIIDEQLNFIKSIKQGAGDQYRNYQKYIAVVQADGDNIGAFIGQLYNENNADELIKQFSKNLLEFGKEAVKLVENYQGTPIYAGGDDLLYFCPVAHTSYNENRKKTKVDKTFLTLIEEIDKLFKRLFNEYNEGGIDFKSIIEKADKKPSMSYGVSISYYKFPLNEALEIGIDQLFYTAKKTCTKNAVSYSVLKHSGQQFGTTFHKHQKSYKTYIKLLEEQVSDENYLHGVVNKLEPQKMVFCTIGKETDKTKRDKLFDNFFYNNFDESVHRVRGDKEKLIPFLKKLKQLFKDVYTENQVIKCKFDNDDDEKKNNINRQNLNQIYAALRFIGFIHNKEER